MYYVLVLRLSVCLNHIKRNDYYYYYLSIYHLTGNVNQALRTALSFLWICVADRMFTQHCRRLTLTDDFRSSLKVKISTGQRPRQWRLVLSCIRVSILNTHIKHLCIISYVCFVCFMIVYCLIEGSYVFIISWFISQWEYSKSYGEFWNFWKEIVKFRQGAGLDADFFLLCTGDWHKSIHSDASEVSTIEASVV